MQLQPVFGFTPGKCCKDCGEGLSGRIDKKFCSDICRNNFHNRKRLEEASEIRNINNILRKNRKILRFFFLTKTPSVSKEILYRKGFDFRYFTGKESIGKKGNLTWYYDFAIAEEAETTDLKVLSKLNA